MKPTPVSVVIPTYNSGRLVTEAVESVLGQTAVPAEIIVVDDGSSDDTRDLLMAYQGRIRYIFQKNAGVSAARNHGLCQASCELVAFLDADDLWHPRKMEFQVEVLAGRPDLGLLGTAVFDWPVPVLPAVDAPTPEQIVVIPWQKLVVKNYFTTSSVIIRRSVLDRVGVFDTHMQGPEDHDFWLRAAEVAAVANLQAPLTGYRTVQGSLSKRAGTMQTGMRRILGKVDERRGWQGRWLLRRKAYSYFNYSCSYMYGAAGHYAVALGNMLKSFAWYPLPYRRSEVRMPLARPKIFLTTLWRMLRGSKNVARPEVGSRSTKELAPATSSGG
jgi:glycosyltransferase involved in cell wall biosynthesis